MVAEGNVVSYANKSAITPISSYISQVSQMANVQLDLTRMRKGSTHQPSSPAASVQPSSPSSGHAATSTSPPVPAVAWSPTASRCPRASGSRLRARPGPERGEPAWATLPVSSFEGATCGACFKLGGSRPGGKRAWRVIRRCQLSELTCERGG